MIKKQRTIKQRILEELPKRCYQIGIPRTEQPKICWNQEQFKWYTGSRKTMSKRRLGAYAYRNNVILIDLAVHAFHNQSFNEVRDTLIHELVHARFQNQKHGHYFKHLIEQIKKGEIFPPRTQADMRFT